MLQALLCLFYAVQAFSYHSYEDYIKAPKPAAYVYPTFGGEIEFSNDDLQKLPMEDPEDPHLLTSSKIQEDYLESLIKYYMKHCYGCTVEDIEDKYGVYAVRIHFPNKWWMDLTQDPFVIEVNTRAATTKGLLRNRGKLSRYLWPSMQAVGLQTGREVELEESAGHLHIGIESAFGDDVHFFRNFLLDFANHPELALGALGWDYVNAPHIQSYRDYKFQQFSDWMRLPLVKNMSIYELANVLHTEVFTASFDVTNNPHQKYQALSFMRIYNEEEDDSRTLKKAHRTLEVRSIFGQQHPEDLLKIATLFEARINYVKQLKRSPVLRRIRPSSMTSQDRVNAFFKYVAETGLSWFDYKDFMAEYLKAYSPSLATVRSVYGKGREYKQYIKESCEYDLVGSN